jgi:hypothetical protein
MIGETGVVTEADARSIDCRWQPCFQLCGFIARATAPADVQWGVRNCMDLIKIPSKLKQIMRECEFTADHLSRDW